MTFVYEGEDDYIDIKNIRRVEVDGLFGFPMDLRDLVCYVLDAHEPVIMLNDGKKIKLSEEDLDRLEIETTNNMCGQRVHMAVVQHSRHEDIAKITLRNVVAVSKTELWFLREPIQTRAFGCCIPAGEVAIKTNGRLTSKEMELLTSMFIPCLTFTPYGSEEMYGTSDKDIIEEFCIKN